MSKLQSDLEALTNKDNWEGAQAFIETELKANPDSLDTHWLFAQLSSVFYQQKNYRKAAQAAERGLKIVSNCPLLLWYYATAKIMLGGKKKAREVLEELVTEGLKQLHARNYDCWENKTWTQDLIKDCVDQLAVL